MVEEKKLKVLVVEDEPLISIFIKKIVLDMGEKIIDICDNSDDAIQVLKNQKPNLIFMDINLKGSMDGINIIRSIQMPYKPTIFFVSAYGDRETIQDALSTNPYNYLVKPIKEEDIQVAIILARKEQRRLSDNLENDMEDKHFLMLDRELKWDKRVHQLFYEETKIDLTHYETLLLERLLNTPNHTVTYEELHYHIYEEADYSLNAISSLIKRIRKKLPNNLIKSCYKMGYKIELFL